MIKSLFRWLVPAFGMALSFGSESRASTSNSTEVRDMRVVGGDSSNNVSANNSNITMLTTDHGAVNGGFTLASQAISGMVANGDNLQSTTRSLFSGAVDASKSALTGALDFADKQTTKLSDAYSRASNAQSDTFNTAVGELAGAWATSKAPDTQMFKWAGIAVAVVAVVALVAPRLKG